MSGGAGILVVAIVVVAIVVVAKVVITFVRVDVVIRETVPSQNSDLGKKTLSVLAH